MSEIQVGAACADFTPKLGLPLMGNFRDDYAARGVHDPLCAKAIVFADRHGTKAGLLAVDICMLDRHNVALIREEIAATCDVPPENVLIHATHTHSAPAASGKIGLEAQVAPHTAVIEAFLRTAASAVAEANRQLDLAVLAVGYANVEGVSFNRRLRRRDGMTQMNWEALQADFDPAEILEAWGPIDPELACLTVQGEQHARAALVNFGLHPAILAGDNWLYSADYPGYLAEAVSLAQDDDFTCLFLNGCCGNVNHVDYCDRSQGRGYRMAEHVGSVLAAAAQRAMDAAVPVAADRLYVSREYVQLDRLKIKTDEKRRCEEILEQARLHPPQGQVDGVPEAYFAELRLRMWREQEQPDRVEVMVLRMGDVAIVGLPGEAFCELGLEIKRRSPARHTLVAGLANDAIGYLPTEASFQQGGYETTVGSTFYEPGSAERLVASAVSQLTQQDQAKVAKKVIHRSAGDNQYLHPDFHGALSVGIEYLHENYGEDAVRRYLWQFAQMFYAPLTDAPNTRGLVALEEHFRNVYQLEGGAAEFKLSEDELEIRVDACPAVTHMRRQGYPVARMFRETTDTVNRAICDQTPFTAELMQYDEQTGRSVQRFYRSDQ